jgi:sugar-specific transcriptional regulator TrmB
MLEKELQNAGLSERESRVYLTCLEMGEASVAKLAKKTQIKRTTVYLLIESLQEKGLIGLIKKGNKTLYVSEDPRKIAEKMEQKKSAIEKILPELLALTNFTNTKPRIKYFEEKRAVEEIYLDTLFYPDQEILSWFPATLVQENKDFFNDYYIKKRLEKKIWVRAIAPKTADMQEYFQKDIQELRQTRLISQNIFNIEVGIILYGKSKLGIVSYDENMGLIIESPKIYRSLKNIFELAWNSLPEKNNL